MSTEKPEEQKQEIVEQLKGDFKNEISKVKTRIIKINKDIKEDTKNDVVEEVPIEENMFTANLGKGKDGISIGESKVNDTSDNVEEKSLQEEGTTSSEILKTENASTTIIKEVDDTSSKDILTEVNNLIESENFDASLEKLDEVNTSFDKEIENGEVKGVMEENEEVTASTTEE